MVDHTTPLVETLVLDCWLVGNSPLASSRRTSMTTAGSRVLELGAGMSGLAGLGLAACSDASEVVITDGNPDALKNLEVSVLGCASAQVERLFFRVCRVNH